MGGVGGGLKALREGFEAENEVVRIPPNIRWLGGAEDIRSRWRGGGGVTASSAALAVVWEATFSGLCKTGVRLLGRRYEVEAFEEDRPDAFYSRYCACSHIGPRCTAAVPGASSARRGTRRPTTGARLIVEGCRGHPCPHGVARSRNCRGPRLPWAVVCPARKEAQ